MAKKNPRTGSTLERLLKEDGSYEDVKSAAIKKVLAHKLEESMRARKISKSQMAAQLETSRSQLDRLLDPDNESVTLHTLKKAAAAIGMRLEIELHQA